MVVSGKREVSNWSIGLSPSYYVFTCEVFHADGVFGSIHKIFTAKEGKHREVDEEVERMVVQHTSSPRGSRKREG